MGNKKQIPEVLRKPVPEAILKPTHLQELGLQQPTVPEAVVVEREQPAYNVVTRQATQFRNQTVLRTKLRVLHDSIESPENKPPCDTCKTSACCVAYMVNITKHEYESGLYGDNAVKLTAQDAKNIGLGRMSRVATMHTLPVHALVNDHYYLEGPIGQPCPFLQDDNKCGIYDIRPVTCRTYSCVDDPRMTEGMRDGTEDIEQKILARLLKQDVDDET